MCRGRGPAIVESSPELATGGILVFKARRPNCFVLPWQHQAFTIQPSVQMTLAVRKKATLVYVQTETLHQRWPQAVKDHEFFYPMPRMKNNLTEVIQTITSSNLGSKWMMIRKLTRTCEAVTHQTNLCGEARVRRAYGMDKMSSMCMGAKWRLFAIVE
ncbi:uncharacterized protein BO97DRAFT_414280 [Aspergillus homomorphus CBS 101889]|uniref:Uncharacterized protein n=1 Tax=Aspergillus homomorphus (strain CBS 101889) TaxID=1450537 RepID=A0A395HXH9_ASPHC|nr:hypothetical protein BO97DRAFT_414280 [Aspergillus homomorphus CBS 101889]RAL12507.1 hypothetical protein BO97DRAFT_414280 [Aspergillus homomorphus CBS 101889]